MIRKEILFGKLLLFNLMYREKYCEFRIILL